MSNEDKIRGLIESWARAVSAGNRKAILAHHSPGRVGRPSNGFWLLAPCAKTVLTRAEAQRPH